MKVNKELFDKWRKSGVAVNTKTLDEYNNFMYWLEENTNYRRNGSKPTQLDWFRYYRSLTCIRLMYDVQLGYCYKSYYIEKGIKVVSFEDLFKPNPFYLMEVGYKVVIKNKFQEREYYMCDEKYVDDVKEDVLTLGCDIVAIYKPKYNGVYTIKDPQWELVWERKEEKFQLMLPKEFGAYTGSDQMYLNIRRAYFPKNTYYCFSTSENTGKWQTVFTKEEIDKLPCKELVAALEQKVYTGNEQDN